MIPQVTGHPSPTGRRLTARLPARHPAGGPAGHREAGRGEGESREVLGGFARAGAPGGDVRAACDGLGDGAHGYAGFCRRAAGRP
ncbi:hypothetical protein GCM10011578_096570 [Streptomyces fuscichromogenes]|uniref:Uncharacterized protein n=1 Tax=Streptomyces fuscichromogenes TaxID=1324013 RepID=A0A918CXD5_9ACTN|nr:hypothetical protein GCM10011578_096570 [Streptomyces fuscichromogenes]